MKTHLLKLRMGIRHIRYRLRQFSALVKTKLGMLIPQNQKPHGQAHKVIISLTSHKPRFSTLHLTLECLLKQTVKIDHLLLWIDDADVPHIPEKILALKSRGLNIRITPKNYASYNKIIHTLPIFPDAFIITVDDDTYYQRNMVEDLLKNWSGSFKEIVCNMAVAITEDASGNKNIFNDWPVLKKDSYPRYDILPFGVGGILYPPGSLPPETTDATVFTALCPRADDIWLYWMARRNGVTYRKISSQPWIVSWPSSQIVGLKYENNIAGDGNDRQAAAMAQKFGWPPLDRI